VRNRWSCGLLSECSGRLVAVSGQPETATAPDIFYQQAKIPFEQFGILAILERACYISSMLTLLSHIEPAINCNRWYLVSVQATLFHPCAVVIAWGRWDNDFPRWRLIPMESGALADQLAADIVERKIRRGYRDG
jgi:predicted DNA-binding WGR domain protein